MPIALHPKARLSDLAHWAKAHGYRLRTTKRGHIELVPKISTIGDLRRDITPTTRPQRTMP